MRLYNLQSRKLDLKTISGYFNSYCISSRSRFYYLSHTIKIIESDRAIYFKDNQNNESIESYNLTLREEHVVLLVPFLPDFTMRLPHINVLSIDPKLHNNLKPMVVEDSN